MTDNGYALEVIDSIVFGDHSPSRPLGSRFRAETGTSGAINAVQIRGEGLSPIFRPADSG